MNTSRSTSDPITPTAAGGRPLPRRWLAVVAAVWVGFAFTSFASMAANYAAVWYVTESTGSPLALAFVYICAFLPVGLLSPLGGVVADRFNRKRVIIVCDLFIAAVAMFMGGAVMLGHVSLPLILITVCACGVGQAFRTPSFNSAMPLMVPEKHLLRINMMDNLLSSFSMIAAPALGIFLYTTIGFQAVLFVNAAGALASVVAMLFARIPTVVSEETVQQNARQNIVEGWRALVSNKGLLAIVLSVVLGMMAYGPIDSILPLMVASHFGGDGYAASLVTAVFGIGMLAGSLALMAKGDSNRLTRVIVAAAFVVGIATTAGGLLPSNLFIAFVVAMGLMAVACAWFNGPLMTLLQKNVAEDKLGRVMGLLSALMGLGIPLGTAIGGTLAENIGVASFFVVDGLFILGIGIVLGLLPSVKALDSAKPASEPVAGGEPAPLPATD